MKGKEVSNDTSMTNSPETTNRRLYDLMSEMKRLIETDPIKAREILIANPEYTKCVFKAQIMLGMIPAPQTSSSSSSESQAAQPNNQAADLQQFLSQDETVKQQQSLPPMAVPAMAVPVPPSNAQFRSSATNPFNHQVRHQPPLPPYPRPSAQANAYWVQTQIGTNVGFQRSGAPPMYHSQPTSFHTGNPPSAPMQLSFVPGQPPLPSQPRPPNQVDKTVKQQQSLSPMVVPAMTIPVRPSNAQFRSSVPTNPFNHQVRHQPLLPPYPRPSVQPNAYQVRTQMGTNVGLQQSGAPPMYHSQPTLFHTGNPPSAPMQPSFVPGQPPLPSQPRPPNQVPKKF